MNGAFVHLAFNHIPVIGIPFGLLLLLAGLLRQSRDLVQAAFVSWVVIALCTVVAFKSGGPAAHTIKGLPGIERSTIHEHAEAADWALRGAVGLAAFSWLGLWFIKKSNAAPKWLSVLLVLGGIGVSGWSAYVAHLGGLIRHPEIAQGFVAEASPPTAGAPMPPH